MLRELRNKAAYTVRVYAPRVAHQNCEFRAQRYIVTYVTYRVRDPSSNVPLPRAPCLNLDQ